jgi:uncharacterized protein (DUF342 family)
MSPTPKTTATATPVQVQVSDDRQAAWLRMAADQPRDGVTVGVCEQALQEAGVACTEAVQQRLAELVANLPPEGEAMEALVAEAVPPAHGQDAAIQWWVQEPNDVSADTSFYERTAYVMVEAGQALGRLIPATDGQAGWDVTGQPQQAQAGQPLQASIDDASIREQADGTLQAQLSGVLVRSPSQLYICQALEIDGAVDFSTGNIDFDGAVRVKEGVRDRFVIRASDCVEVNGLIEAATIKTEGDLLANGGMTGRQTGQVRVGGDLIARYLDSITGLVSGALQTEREVIDSDLRIGGDVAAPRGSWIGGRLAAGGEVQLGRLGSPGARETELVFGTLPRIEQLLAQLRDLREKAVQRHSDLTAEQERLQPNDALTESQRQRRAEVTAELKHFDQHLADLDRRAQSLVHHCNEHVPAPVHVMQHLHAGVILNVTHKQLWLILDDHKGPVTIHMASDGAIYLQTAGGAHWPLRDIARRYER